MPLVVEREGRRLVARLVTSAGGRVLLLEEQRIPQPADLGRLGLSHREAEVMTWVSQGKTNSEIAMILGNSEATVKKHVLEIFQKLGVETRTAASLRALEVLSSPAAHGATAVAS
jgi:DNA-binding CsgD family transcriptional regulator